MDNTNTIPYIVHEGCLTRYERITKRLIIVLIITVTLMFTSNGMWLYAWMQYDYEGETVTESTTTTTTQDGDGVNIFGSGDVNYGSEGNNKDHQSETQ